MEQSDIIDLHPCVMLLSGFEVIFSITKTNSGVQNLPGRSKR